MENENITMENTAETAAVEAPNKNMKPCKVCGKQIAKKAKTCPYCGAKNKKSHKGLIALLIIIVVAVAAAVVVIKPFGLNIIPFGTSNTEEAKAKITDKNGNIVYMTAKEVKSLENANEALFDKLYKGAKIEFTGTVKRIETNYTYDRYLWFDSIEFEEGWLVELSSGSEENLLLKMNPGTKVSVSSNISYCHGDVVLKETSSTATRISIVE